MKHLPRTMKSYPPQARSNMKTQPMNNVFKPLQIHTNNTIETVTSRKPRRHLSKAVKQSSNSVSLGFFAILSSKTVFCLFGAPNCSNGTELPPPHVSLDRPKVRSTRRSVRGSFPQSEAGPLVRLLGTSATLLGTGALLVVTRSY